MELKELIAIISAAKHPEDIFGAAADLGELTKKYRFFSILTHPDKHPTQPTVAAKAFSDVGNWLAKAKDKMKRGTYGDRKAMQEVTITTKAGTYTLTELIGAGALSDVMGGTLLRGRSTATDVAVKIVRNPRNNDLMLAEANNLKAIHAGAEDKPYKGELMFIPKVMGSFQVGDRKGRAANVTKWLHGYVSLADVMKAYPGGIDPRDAAWMFNRLLSALCVTHEQEYVHGAVLPQHIMVNTDPNDHHGVLIDWCYSVKSMQKLKALDSDWKSYYPHEAISGSPVSPATDTYMAAGCLLLLLGNSPPAKMQSLIAACLLAQSRRIQNAIELQKDFGEVLTKLYGVRKFRKFDWSAINKNKTT